MGTTLSNGVYLPDEGERNCYAGLKVNWEILNQKVADIRALQLAIAGALHREIVENLPTTDIDPNTIYMILNGTSATENVYNEFMYVNNAWELIGTSATDLTNYYTKSEVDGKLLLKANASDLTSHTGDTTIHVTASDKTKWTNSANTHVLRLALSALTPSTSDNSFSNLDDSTALKVGDKVMDTAGVLFEVTAIDTANSTFTIGTSLIDLAQDSDVVHKSGDETVAGFKTFENIRLTNSIRAISLDGETVDINNCYSSFAPANSPKNGNVTLYSCNTDDGTANISNLPVQKAFYLISIAIRFLSNNPTVKQILFTRENVRYERFCSTGTWSNWVNVSDSEYVHKSGNETVGGQKTFIEYITSDGATTGDEYSPNAKTNLWLMANRDTEGVSGILIDTYRQNTAQGTGSHILGISIKENSVRYEGCRFSWGWDNNLNGYSFDFKPTTQGTYQAVKHNLGTSTDKWDTLNGLNPGSLSFPDISMGLDISAYITDLTGTSNVNKYTPTVNGWLSIGLSGADFIELYIPSSLFGGSFTKSTVNNYAQAFMPVIANKEVRITLKGSSIGWAKFYPCQGNV